MPLIIWFIVWWFNGFPAVHMWNAWAVALAICTAWTFLGD